MDTKDIICLLEGIADRARPCRLMSSFQHNVAETDDIYQEDLDALYEAMETLDGLVARAELAVLKFSFLTQSEMSPVGRAIHEAGTTAITTDFIFGSV